VKQKDVHTSILLQTSAAQNKIKLVRKKTAFVVLLAGLCYILGLVTAFYFPIPTHLGAGLTRLLHGKVRSFIVSRNFNETIGYVADRRVGPVLEDLYWLIRDDYPAAKRHLLRYNGSKDLH